MEMANQWKTHRGVFIAWAVEFVTIANRPSCNRWFCVFYEKVRRPLSWKSNICDLVRNVSFFQESQTIYYLQSQLCRTEPSFRVDVNETKVKSKLKACDRLLFDKALLRTLTPNSLTGTCCTQGPVEGHNVLGAEKSQQRHKYFLQYSTIAPERPQVRTWGTKLASCPGRHLTSIRPLVACSGSVFVAQGGRRGDGAVRAVT